MKVVWRCVFGGLLLTPVGQAAMAIEPGQYEMPGLSDGSLTLSVEGDIGVLEVKTDGCQGDTRGIVQPVGAGQWQLRPIDMPECVIGLAQQGDVIAVTEGSECFGLHGAMCTFDGTLVAIGAQPGAAAAPVVAGAMSPGGESWTYGVDMELGLSAHIRTPDGAVGLACLADGSDPATAWILGVRVSPGLVGPQGAVYMFEGRTDALDIPDPAGGIYAERKDTTCGVGLDAFRAAQSMILIDGKIAAVSAGAAGMEITLDQGGTQTVVFDGTDAAAKVGGRQISLKGSSAAISALLRDCPFAQYDIDTNCGL